MPVTRGRPRVGFTEFVVLVAAMMSSQALAIDAMLPAFPTIVRALGVINENHGQWIVTSYMAGMGVGQLFWGTAVRSLRPPAGVARRFGALRRGGAAVRARR